ncbi:MULTISPECIES: type IV pilin protein [unclassified Acinetobacter]|uniref:type IV pilin protein n=1 Tax=unclassified Acinetobacter TaxID=196816 RepID=UPI002934F803|nr:MULTISPECIES: type IV pilin protein [unclassified Acinetobacter]WOE31094.1 type IV pilin protein [Acinetobacter sp. SAAs470]WOE39290.1 type IV pilin protein [Acinetobacter sp. SAAs474]
MKKGFSLIELMLVIVIMAILIMMVYPDYQQYVRHTKRIEAQAELTALAKQLQRYKVVNLTFLKANGKPITLVDIGEKKMLYLPRAGRPLYQIKLSQVGINSWLLTATPLQHSTQWQDGGFALNHRGEKCWIQGLAKCVPSATSQW